MCKIDFSLILVIVALIHKAENKRYDIETQCKEEFGLTLEGVLKQFRRSDDYVKIISHKLDNFVEFFEDVILQSYDYNVKKMIKRIEADFDINHDVSTPTKQTTAASGAGPDKRILRIHRLRRNNENMSEKTSREQVEQIEAIPSLKSHLTVDERNKYKEVAYTYAGDIIHSAIEALGGKVREDERPHGSTQIAREGAENETTTQHVLRHIVEHPSTKLEYHDTDVTRQKKRERTADARKFMSSYQETETELHPYTNLNRSRNTEESYEWRDTTPPQRLMYNSGGLSIDDDDEES